MRVLVCGDRHWQDRELLFATLDGYKITLVIEGCARGADRLGEQWAQERGIPVEHHPANWERFGRAAGPIRNTEMLRRHPDMVIAFHDDLSRSRGTIDTVSQAHDLGLPVVVIRHE